MIPKLDRSLVWNLKVERKLPYEVCRPNLLQSWDPGIDLEIDQFGYFECLTCGSRTIEYCSESLIPIGGDDLLRHDKVVLNETIKVLVTGISLICKHTSTSFPVGTFVGSV